VAARVDAHLGRPAIVSPGAAALFIEAQIAPAATGPGWQVHIGLTADDAGMSGVRDISSPNTDCAEAADSAALAIALMIDPKSGQVRSEASFTEPMPEPPPPPAGPHRAPSSESARVAREREPTTAEAATSAGREGDTHWRARVAFGALGTLGQLPGPALGVTGGIALSPPQRHAGVELGGMYLVPRRAELRPGAGGEFSASALIANGWWSPYVGRRLSVTWLAGGQVGRIAAGGFGFRSSNRMADSWLLNITTQAELGWLLSQRWQGLLRVGLGVPLWKDSFDAVGPGGTSAIFRPSAVIGSLSIGMAVAP
jgi:hypothetical protein